MYSFDSRVRYSECDENAKLTLSALVNYLQDTTTFHSESLGLGMDYWNEHNTAWILSYWHIDIHRFLELGEEIHVRTWPYELLGYKAHRNFTIEDSKGDIVANANSLWIYMDVEKGRMKKVDEDQQASYVLKPAYPMAAISRKVALPELLTEKECFRVQRFYIDSNQHVNNEKYILMASEYIPTESAIKSLRVEYRKSAVLGDMIYPHVGLVDDRVTVSLCDENKKPYANVEFTLAVAR